MSEAVEIAVNCYERTYQKVLAPGFFPRLADECRRPFQRRVALLNNIGDRAAAAARAAALIERGELDEAYSVADSIDEALARTGLARRDLGRIPHYSDFALVAACRAQCPWLLLWDAEATLAAPCDWVSPALALFARDARVFAANPLWELPGWEREVMETSGEFALGYGFSDQMFLARARELAAPIYRARCAASCRYPTAHIASTFEERIDAYMRTKRRVRATFTGAVYRHPHRGNEAYRPRGIAEWVRRARNRALLRRLARSRSPDPRRRLYWS
ncbi:MAG: hypothetical protein L0Z55_08730 [Planctomycetes bacterium]|nr:hypothetical protein [Planctomycetota bacterium]